MSKMGEEIEKLTIELVNMPSVSNTEGERELSNKIFSFLKEIEYFKRHEEYVFKVPLKNDKMGRSNVFALLKGEKGNSGRTIILYGHMDTVGIDDFGNLAKYAFDPKILMEKLEEIELPEEVKEDLQSGDWLFGRGASDMKSGDAVHLVVLKELSKLVEEIDGNILFISEADEENQNIGMIEVIEVLNELKDKYKLQYVMAINNDYICPMYKGDKAKYIYTGTVGKLLPSFYFVGKETHVGQCFEGLNPDAIAGEVINEINLNVEMCDEYKGEYTLPPSVLKFTDLKSSYNVQTPFSAFAYFNYAVYNESPDETLGKLKKAAENAFERVIRKNEDRYRKYCGMVKQEYRPLNFMPKVITYSELYKEAEKNFDGDLNKEIEAYTKEILKEDMDSRYMSLKIVEKVFNICANKKPCIVIFFAAAYCPHNTLKSENHKEKEIIDKIKACTDELNEKEGINEEFKMMQFFPSISDSSYLKIDDDFDELYSLTSNFPGWNKIYGVPLKEIKKLNIPSINYGCYGKDAHKWTERVYKPYSFEVLPKLIMLTVKKFL